MSTLELDRLEEDVAKARERVVADVARLRSSDAFEEFKGDIGQTFSDTAQRTVAGLKNRAAANPAAVLAIAAGLLWRFARHPPIASLLVGVGLASLLRTSSDSPPSPVVTRSGELLQSANETVSELTEQAREFTAQAREAAAATATRMSGQVAEAAARMSEGAGQIAAQASRSADRVAAAAQRALPDVSARDGLLLGVAALAVGAAALIGLRRGEA